MDASEEAALTSHELRDGERDGKPTKIAIARRVYPVEQAELWDAVTNFERLPKSFLPIEGEARVGGRYQLTGNAGGTIERCEEPNEFAVTWEMGGQVSWLAVVLSAADEAGTELELVHEAHVDPAFWEQFGPGAVGVGWDLALMGLGRHLADPASVDPAELATWPGTGEGQAFVRASCDSWAQAQIANGDDEAAAQRAADGTYAFYTGTSPIADA